MTMLKPREEEDESEAAADPDDSSTRRRGRPRVTPDYWDKGMAAVKPDLHRKSHVKHFRAVRTLQVLETAPDNDFSYLIDSENARMDILAELGLIEDESVLLVLCPD